MAHSLSPQDLKSLSTPNVWPWLWRAIFDWAQIAGAFFLLAAYPSALTFVVAWFVIGAKINSLSLLGHDAAHYLISRDRRLNDTLAYIFLGIPLTLSLSGYRKFHFEHHRHQGNEHDPEIQYQGQRSRWSRPLSKRRLGYLFMTDLMGLGLKDIIIGLGAYKSQKKFEPIFSAIFFSGVAFVCWKTNTWWMLGFWVFCSITSHWALFRLRTVTEHSGINETMRMQANPFVRYFIYPHNTHMHYEHHAYPTVPLWNLPELRAKIYSTIEIQTQRKLWDSVGKLPAFPWR